MPPRDFDLGGFELSIDSEKLPKIPKEFLDDITIDEDAPTWSLGADVKGFYAGIDRADAVAAVKEVFSRIDGTKKFHKDSHGNTICVGDIVRVRRDKAEETFLFEVGRIDDHQNVCYPLAGSVAAQANLISGGKVTFSTEFFGVLDSEGISCGKCEVIWENPGKIMLNTPLGKALIDEYEKTGV